MEVWRRDDSVEFESEEEAEIEAMVAEMRERKPKYRYAVDAWGDLYEVNPTE